MCSASLYHTPATPLLPSIAPVGSRPWSSSHKPATQAVSLQTRCAAHFRTYNCTPPSPAENLPFPDDTFSHAFTNCKTLHFDDALAKTPKVVRTLERSGTAVLTSWKVLKAIDVVRTTQHACGHQEPLFRPPVDEKWFKAETLEHMLKDAEFRIVDVSEAIVHVAGKNLKDVRNCILGLTSRYSQD